MSVVRMLGTRRSLIDLETVRDTLDLIREDLAADSRNRAICDKLEQAIAEIDSIAQPRPRSLSGPLATTFGGRFVPWRPDAE